MLFRSHALLQKGVEFARLGLAVIDEQHRFGVQQRVMLRRKAEEAVPHQLMMSATPIPRTLSMTYYADLDVSVIDELPPGRRPVTTRLVSAGRRGEVLARIRDACAEGQQAYWVCPVIEESKESDIRTALDTFEKLVKEFDIRLAIHDHPRKPNDPNYKVWDPHYIMQVTKDRDARIGACAVTGHWQTSGLNPVYCLRVLKGRLISSHMKDKVDYGPSHDVPYGEGVGEIGRCLDELKKQGFEGNISVEYEYKWENNVPDVTKCIEFVRNHKGAQK